MIEFISGILKGATPKNTKIGQVIVVDIARLLWDKASRAYIPGEQISVLYSNDAAKYALRALNYQDKVVILTANKEEVNGKVSYYGRLAPTTYGLLRIPVQMNPTATPDDFVNADMGIEDCIACGALDKLFTLNLEEKNTSVLASQIWSAISVLTAMRKNGDVGAVVENTITSTVSMLYKLIVPPSAAYIGMIMSHTMYDADTHPNIKLSITIPSGRNGARDSQWCDCRVFAPRDTSDTTSNYHRMKYLFTQKLLNDKDRAILFLSGEQSRNETLSFTCYAFQRV